MPDSYHFAPLTRADLPLLCSWLAQPHVRAWWDDPATEIAAIAADLDQNGQPGRTDMRLVAQGGAPFAYVQDWPLATNPWAHLAGYPQTTRVIDTLIGPPESLRQGHASRFLAQRAASLRTRGAAAVLSDPDPANIAALRALHRAGFQTRAITTDPAGHPVQVMQFDPALPAAALSAPSSL